MKTTAKILGAFAGSLLLVAPLAASAQMVDPDNVQDEVNVPGDVETAEPAEPAEVANVPDVPDAPGVAEAPDAPEALGLSR